MLLEGVQKKVIVVWTRRIRPNIVKDIVEIVQKQILKSGPVVDMLRLRQMQERFVKVISLNILALKQLGTRLWTRLLGVVVSLVIFLFYLWFGRLLRSKKLVIGASRTSSMSHGTIKSGRFYHTRFA
jgi:hypothetical protein